MQTTTLPIQLSSASPSPAPQRANAAASADAKQFSRTLSREMAQHQHSAAPAAAKAAPQAKDAAGATAGTDTGSGESKDDAADAAAVSPVTDMLALVASFNQPAAIAPAPVTDPLAASVAAQATELPAVTGTQLAVDADAGKAQAPLIAVPDADGKEPAFKDVKQAIEGAARFAMKVPGGTVAPDAKPTAAAPAAPPSILEAASTPRTAAVSDGAAAPVAAAAQKPEAEGYVAVTANAGARAEPAPVPVRADAAPLHAREAVADVAALKEPAAAAPVTAPVQQASLAMAQAVTGAPTDRIAARVGTPGWDNQVAQKIVWMVAGKEQSASLTLNPPDMGPMQVVLSVTNDQATVTFSAAQPEVRQALENAMPKLREMMGESGIALGNATVNAGTPDQRQAQQGEQPRSQAAGSRFGGGNDGAPIAPAVPRQTRPGGGAGLVDTFA
jgi:flagellar hook-length control protein FliK